MVLKLNRNSGLLQNAAKIFRALQLDKSRDGFTGGGGVQNGCRGRAPFFMVKQKHIRDKMRFVNE
jgi:hypothetical protein